MPKLQLTLVHKTNLLPTAVSMIFKTDSETPYIQGQFLSLLVAPKTYRSYSLFYCDANAPTYYETNLPKLESGKYIGLMINTKPMGLGSQKAIEMQVGETIDAIGYNGKFTLVQNDRPKVFVASSTGLAPFVPLIEQIMSINPTSKIQVFFGAFVPNDDFTAPFFAKYPSVEMISCYDEIPESDITPTKQLGRVTAVIPKLVPDITGSDFYICGNPFMVSATQDLLVSLGVETIYTEKFGV